MTDSEAPDQPSEAERQELERRRVVELVDARVRQYLDEQWSWFRRFVLPLVVALAAVAGVKGYLTLELLDQQSKELASKTEQATRSAAEANRLVQQADQLKRDAAATLTQTLQIMGDNVKSVTENNKNILEAQHRSSDLLTTLAQRSQTVVDDARQAAATLGELERTKQQAKREVEEYLEGQKQRDQESLKELTELSRQLEGTARTLVDLRASDTLLLRTRGEAHIKLPDPCDPSGGSIYELSFVLKEKIKNDFKVAFTATPRGGAPIQGELKVYDSMKRGQPNPTGSIPDTPFAFEAFVYHDRIAADFAVLKIRKDPKHGCPRRAASAELR